MSRPVGYDGPQKMVRLPHCPCCGAQILVGEMVRVRAFSAGDFKHDMSGRTFRVKSLAVLVTAPDQKRARKLVYSEEGRAVESSLLAGHEACLLPVGRRAAA